MTEGEGGEVREPIEPSESESPADHEYEEPIYIRSTVEMHKKSKTHGHVAGIDRYWMNVLTSSRCEHDGNILIRWKSESSSNISIR